MQASLKEENYLKALIKLSDIHGNIGVKQLSDMLHVTMPTINAMMKKFHQKGWVIYETYKPLKLTASGRKLGLHILRKHRLTEMFLVKIMGIGWESVHDIAEQIEHLDSPLFFDKMDEILGFPNWDPHGAPIPDIHGHIKIQSGQSLADCQQGDDVILVAVRSENPDFLAFLNEKNIRLHDHINVIEIEKYDKSLTIKHNKKTLHFSRQIAEQLWVSPNK